MPTETYDPAELLRALPLVKDVKPHHLHTSVSREPLVVTNGDLRRAFPVEGVHGRPELFPLPLGRLRRLLQLWPEGEPVRVEHGAECPVRFQTRHLHGGHWEWAPVKHTEPRRFIVFSGGSFQAKLYEPDHYCYRRSPGNWTYSQRSGRQW